MTKQIYVNIAVMILCIILWFSLAVSILYFSKTINKVDKILSILEKPQTCNLDYSIQDKIERTYETINSATCNIEK